MASTVSSPAVTRARVVTRMVGADALPVLEVRRVGVQRRDGGEQALRHELEEPSNVQVVAQHLRDGAAGLAARLVARARDAVGDREALSPPPVMSMIARACRGRDGRRLAGGAWAARPATASGEPRHGDQRAERGQPTASA